MFAEVGLMRAPDTGVWDYAKANGFTIVTADGDFFELVTSAGPPPKVIWLRRWARSTRDAEALLRREAIRISEFCANTEQGLLVLDW